jgi:hypothetical protein
MSKKKPKRCAGQEKRIQDLQDLTYEQLMALPAEELLRRAEVIRRDLESPRWSEDALLRGIRPKGVLGIKEDCS